jgi:hypothetical protein
MRIYSPNDVVETKTIAPVSYATTWTSGNKSLRVHQTEVIGRVSANSTWFPSWNDNYSVATFPINPANPKTFPWLSYIARLYDKYRFYSLRFIYVNSVSTQQEGNVMMSLDYDTLDAAPANLIQASQLAKYKLTPIYYPADFSIPTSHPGNNQWLYTFDLSATTNTVDLKTYNLGNFFLALDGVPQDGKDYGYLAVEYDVELLDKNPITSDSIFASSTYDTGSAPSKKNRSNVDPADTMDLTITWKKPSAASATNLCTIVFSDNVSPGTKARLVLLLRAGFAANSAVQTNLGFSTPTLPDSMSLLETDVVNPNHNTTDTYTLTGYFNFDVTVPDDRTLEITFNSYTNCKFQTGGTYSYKAMSYTYA